MWSQLFAIAFFCSTCHGAPKENSRVKRDDEKDLFDLWIKAMEEGFDQEFEEFMKGMEESKDNTRGVSRSEVLYTTSTSTHSRMSQNTTDRFQELMASMRKDVTDEFWKFMKSMVSEMQAAFDGMMTTMEKEMDANFDQFMQTMMGEDSRTMKKTYEAQYQEWKAGQIEIAQKKFDEYYSSKKTSRSTDDDPSDDPARNVFDMFPKVLALPLPQQQESQTLSPETQVLAPAIEASSTLIGAEGQGKAGNSPSPIPISPQNLAGAVPGPIKDRIPGALSGMANSSSTPTLFLGGFSILMMPMPNGLADMQQMFMQGAPNLMSMAPPLG